MTTAENEGANLAQEPALAERLAHYNVSWSSPSQDSSGSMPLGNGDIGMNMWVEPAGDLVFFLSKTDAWSEIARLLKLTRIRFRLSPQAVEPATIFLQTLHLYEGAIEVQLKQGEMITRCLLWVDAHHPAVHVEFTSSQPITVQAHLEPWRTQARSISGRERHSAYGMMEAPYALLEDADVIVPGQRKRVAWFHRNERSLWTENMHIQGLEPLIPLTTDPLLYRTFGGMMEGAGFVQQDEQTLISQEAATIQRLTITLLTLQTETAEEWLRQLTALHEQQIGFDYQETYQAHRTWWQNFWQRSWIFVTGDSEAERVTQGYLLQRFVTACAGRGAAPIKFNGSLFTVDQGEAEERFNADYRRWGGPYWFQNTRLCYWPLLLSGDGEFMQPLFEMYLQALPLARARTELYFQHKGAFFPETMYFWGTYATDDFGWDRTNKQPGFVESPYIRHYFQGNLELLLLGLDYYAFTHDTAFVTHTLLPLAAPILQFYDLHYQRDAAGKLRLEPAQSLEMWHSAVNPLPDIAGLQVVLQRLLELPELLVEHGLRADWQRLLQEVPSLPTIQEGAEIRLLPAEQVHGPTMNSENPELYAIFPYRLYGVGRQDGEIGLTTFAQRRIKRPGGWQQEAIQAACLGLAHEAHAGVVAHFSTESNRSRFPAFWGPNYDWTPDQDHGSVGMLALQNMLFQAVGEQLLVLPAWPQQWDVDFQLRGPGQTVITGRYRSGKLTS